MNIQKGTKSMNYTNTFNQRIISSEEIGKIVCTNKEFKKMLEDKEYKIVALKNNEKSNKYFKGIFKDSKYMIFNLSFGIDSASYVNNLLLEKTYDTKIEIV